MMWFLSTVFILCTLCGASSALRSDNCAPNDPSELAKLFTHCPSFYRYYRCAKGNSVHFDKSAQWGEAINKMLETCSKYISGLNTLDSDICAPGDPAELAKLFTHCHLFYRYYLCAQDNDISFNKSGQWGESVHKMMGTCSKYISDVQSVPELDIDLNKMSQVLKDFIKPSGWNPCNNFHAYTCEHSARRLYSSPKAKRSGAHGESEVHAWSIQDEAAINATMDQRISEMIRSLNKNNTEWTGPSWVRKLLLVLGTCEANETYCKEIDFLPLPTWMKNFTTTTKLLRRILYVYIAPTLPGYERAKNFTQALTPFILKETASMVREWAGAGNTTELLEFIEKKLTLHIGIQEGSLEKMDNLTESLVAEAGNNAEIYDNFFNWWVETGDRDIMQMLRGQGFIWNAFTDARGNAYFGGTVLVPPAFDLDLSYAFLIGDSVFVLFHEVGHNLMVIMEKNKEHIEGFYSYFHDCLVDEYGKFPVYFNGSELLNGTQTFPENFADVIGLQLAWRFYQKYYYHRDKIPEESGFTKEQVFFAGVSSSAVMCNPRYRDKAYAERHQAMDVHTIGENRLNLLLMHTPQFATEFKCPIGSTMNPYKNCVKLLDLKKY